MEKTSTELAKFLGVSKSSITVILCRAGFEKYQNGKKYRINYDFIQNLYDYFDFKKKNAISRQEKYKQILFKLKSWQRRIVENNYDD